MRILVLGDDGRAHALVWKLFRSPQVDMLVCTPGNGGTVQLAPRVIELDAHTLVQIAGWAFDQRFTLLLPSVCGQGCQALRSEADVLHLPVFLPALPALQIVQSRCAAKELLLRAGLPTAPGAVFDNLPTAEKYLAAQTFPIVIKADHPDGSALTYSDRYEALQALREIFAERQVTAAPDSPDAMHGVVIEAQLEGVLVSLTAVTDGQTVHPFPLTRIYNQFSAHSESHIAPGMGAHTGVSSYVHKLTTYLRVHCLQPLVAALCQQAGDYRGLLGIDCLITRRGPYITDVRASLHDMEAQVVLPRLETDLVPLLEATQSGTLGNLPPLVWHNQATVGTALVAEGYPHHFAIGSHIEGLAQVDPGVLVFHHQTHNRLGLVYNPAAQREPGTLARVIMGVGRDDTTNVITTGGHVVTVVAAGETLPAARRQALANAQRIQFASRYVREDIGLRGFKP